jgi:hypothetical protein
VSRAGHPAHDSPECWRAARAGLNQRRHPLTQAAARFYPGTARVGTTPLLCRPQWIPSRPLAVDEVRLTWAGHPPAAAVTGAEPASAHVRPLRADGRRYRGYADALAALDPPAAFENRPSYRLLAADLTAGAGHMDLSLGRYFDGVNVGEALAHELAGGGPDAPGPVPAGRLPFRELAGDPCDLSPRSPCAAPPLATHRSSCTGATRPRSPTLAASTRSCRSGSSSPPTVTRPPSATT